MKDRDKARFRDNVNWFNQFFDGIRQIYELIINLMPMEFFPEGFIANSGNFFFPRHKAAPSMPAYYGLVIEGRKYALQVVSVIDASLFAQGGPFIIEPSMIVVVHSQVEKYGWLNDFALKVIRNQQVEITRKVGDVSWGKISAKYPADFFTFQIQYDRFSDNKSPQEAVSSNIVEPIITNLEKGFKIA